VTIEVEDGIGDVEIQLADHARAFLSADHRLLAVEIDDTRMFGDPFDQDAIDRAVAWAREQLAGRVAG
jgi:hypothetical protein